MESEGKTVLVSKKEYKKLKKIEKEYNSALKELAIAISEIKKGEVTELKREDLLKMI